MPNPAYDWKSDRFGGITLTRLEDGETRYLQHEDNLTRFAEELEGIDKANDKGPFAYARAVNDTFNPYFEGGDNEL